MKLMIVDDSLVIRRKIERCACVDSSIRIYTAANGEDAVKLFKKEMPEIVTMDLTMPGMDGVECVKQLIKLKPDVHILVVSALSDQATALQAIKNGAEGFIKKPFSDEALNDALIDILEV